MKHLMMLAVCAALMAACRDKAPSEPANPASMPEMTSPESFSEADETACTEAGGRYEQAGLLGRYRCTEIFTDGGEACTDDDQCQGRCVTEPESDAPKPGEGICQPNDNPFGCYSNVVDGMIQPGLCVD